MRARIPEAIAADLGRRFGSEAIARGVAAAEEQVAMQQIEADYGLKMAYKSARFLLRDALYALTPEQWDALLVAAAHKRRAEIVDMLLLPLAPSSGETSE